MQFQVPQFIEVEDKIFGPLTLKQFLYLLGGAAAIFLLYAFLPTFLIFILGPLVGALAVSLAFLKINGRPFIKTMEYGLKHLIKAKVYTWKNREDKAMPQKANEGAATPAGQSPLSMPKLTKSKLEDLAWSLDIKNGKK